MTAAQRAYGDAAKDQRRREILDAADQLFSIEHVLPTALAVAEGAGLAKGTLYRYFDSLELLFASLLLERWLEAWTELDQELAEVQSPGHAVDKVIDKFVGLFASQPGLLRLDAMLPEFKSRMSEHARSHFNTAIDERMTRTGATIERLLDLPGGRGAQLLARSNAFARGLWRTCEMEGPMRAPGEHDERFATELMEALAEYWRGARSIDPAG